RVRREPLGERFRRDRKGHVADLGASIGEPRHRSAAAELAVVRMRSQHENTPPRNDHDSALLAAAARPARAINPSSAQNMGSSKNALQKRLCTATTAEPRPKTSIARLSKPRPSRR